jgi:hypothetical protein
MICFHHSLTQGDIKIGLDGSEALNQSQGDWPIIPSQADFDMLMDIQQRISCSPITWHWHWI